VVGTYAYVNPVVAVLLGWLVLGEAVTSRTIAAMVLILGAVLMIQLAPKRGPSPVVTAPQPVRRAA
jgi:drug/metabolite transporter (DMT)-like permease